MPSAPEPRIAPSGAGLEGVRDDADGIRARRPELFRAYAETRATVLEQGIVDPELKRLCLRYLAEDDEVVGFERSDALDARQRAALRWTHAIAWNAEAGDDLWQALHESFSEPELVELGYFIAFEHGQRNWLATLGVAQE